MNTETSALKRYPRIGVGILLFNPQKQILLGQRKASHGSGYWAPPGGHLEWGESPEECAKREVLEETAIKLDNVSLALVTNDFFAEEDKHYVTLLMVAPLNYHPDPINCEPEKNSGWEWFDLNHLPSPLFSPLQQQRSHLARIAEQQEYAILCS